MEKSLFLNFSTITDVFFFLAKPKPADTAAAVVASGGPGRPAGGATGGKYVPPNQRGGPEGRRGDAMGSRFNARDGAFKKQSFK